MDAGPGFSMFETAKRWFSQTRSSRISRHVSAFTRVAMVMTTAMVTAACGSSESPRETCQQTSQALTPMCATGPTIKGIDVSHHNGVVDWAKAKDAGGVVYAIARVSDGLATPDTQFMRNWPAMKQAGIIRGVYQYFRPSRDPIEQAKLLLQRVADAGGFAEGDLPPAIDVETDSGVEVTEFRRRVRQWLDYVEQQTQRKPIFYTYPAMAEKIGVSFGDYPLWIANYNTSCPKVPDGWTKWLIWQRADTGTVPGVDGAVDLNDFNGDMAALHAFAGIRGPVLPPSDAGSSATPTPGKPDETTEPTEPGEPDPCAPRAP